MRKIRVLIIGDTIVVRRTVADAIAADPVLEVVGVAAGIRLGLAKVVQAGPDLVVLGAETPGRDGAVMLATIRRDHPLLTVLLFGGGFAPGDLAAAGARASGGITFVAGPSSSSPAGLAAAIHGAPGGLIATIKRVGREAAGPFPARAAAVAVPSAPGGVEVLAIGASTGGPDALAWILSSLPADFPAPILIVQHMPPSFTRFLAERLENHSAFQVEEAATGYRPLAGHARVAPGGVHMVVARDAKGARVVLNEDPPEQSCRPSVDVLFRSVAAAYGPAAMAVVLTGMGRDGQAGCEAIRAAGGQVLAQDESTSVVWGMPGQVARAGLADRVLPLGELAPEIDRRSRRGKAPRGKGGGGTQEAPCR